MEDFLKLYAKPYDANHSVVCFDECPYQMVEETRTPLPAKPGRPARYDLEYKRQGTSNLFVFFQPLYFLQADKIRLVLDNLNIHNTSSLV